MENVKVFVEIDSNGAVDFRLANEGDTAEKRMRDTIACMPVEIGIPKGFRIYTRSNGTRWIEKSARMRRDHCLLTVDGWFNCEWVNGVPFPCPLVRTDGVPRIVHGTGVPKFKWRVIGDKDIGWYDGRWNYPK